MNISLNSTAFAASLVLAGIMGFAIQRGATCSVLAVEEIIVERRTTRLQSLLLASAWVLAGLLLAHALGYSMGLPSGYRLGFNTVAGGALLGLGAWVNQSCVFGSIAKIGSGHWSYLATPFGYYLGCAAAVSPRAGWQAASPVPATLPMAISLLIALPLLATLLWLLMRAVWPGGESGARPNGHLHHLLSRRVWQPGAATMVIGVTFLGTWLLVGAWSYTDLLSELAKGMPMDIIPRCLLFLALLGGAVAGGWSAGRLHRTAIPASKWIRCLAGGALMGLGSLLIPGGNDGLLLVGMPLLWSYAWSAVAAMGLTIGIAIVIERRWQRARQPAGA